MVLLSLMPGGAELKHVLGAGAGDGLRWPEMAPRHETRCLWPLGLGSWHLGWRSEPVTE